MCGANSVSGDCRLTPGNQAKPEFGISIRLSHALVLRSVRSRSSCEMAWSMAAKTDPWSIPQLFLLPWIDIQEHELGEHGAGLAHDFEHAFQGLVGAVPHAAAILGPDEVTKCAQSVREIVEHDREGPA
jgi:hypothetical protein